MRSGLYQEQTPGTDHGLHLAQSFAELCNWGCLLRFAACLLSLQGKETVGLEPDTAVNSQKMVQMSATHQKVYKVLQQLWLL